ncbi:MAG: ImmA/IrrE family metallo-endopeptidase [Candidatus Bipolaricaulis sp.]|nr:ImmA/IrrE family metallo-endopeptidase [Candidatus Bipolaricaulis sp.]HRT97414.1 ImmA/IrrE family metallo-endopeptidase [Planctomycetota bacterium]
MAGEVLRVQVNPKMLRWAKERAGLDLDALPRAFRTIDDWEQAEWQPTMKQLERFAAATHVPLGYLFLDAPPDEELPIPDFRTMARPSRRPSPDLLDTIYLCEQRQDWYRGYLKGIGEEPRPFVASARVGDDAGGVAAQIRSQLRFNIAERSKLPSWTEAMRRFVEQAEQAGILVMASGIVGSNTHRKLSPEEFRGFTLVDDLAPLVFVNAADTKSAQMFTLAHELAHIWLGESGVSDAHVARFTDERTERWCDQVAAELLVPLEDLRAAYRPEQGLQETMANLARQFKVSTLVILRRLREAEILDREEFWASYEAEIERLTRIERPGAGGGDFYRTLNVRVSKPFAQAVVISTLEGQTLFRDAYRMLGIRNPATFQRLAQVLELA